MSYIELIPGPASGLAHLDANGVVADRANNHILAFQFQFSPHHVYLEKFNYTTGALISETLLTTITSGGTNNDDLSDRSLSLGADGFFYVMTTATATPQTSARISKISLSSVTEVGSVQPTLFANTANYGSINDFYMVPFTQGGVQYLALVQEYTTHSPNIEIINCATMTSVATGAYSPAGSRVGVVPTWGATNAGEVFLSLTNYGVSPAHSVLVKASYTGSLTLTTIKNYAPSDLISTWTDLWNNGAVFYDPNDSTVVTWIQGVDPVFGRPVFRFKLNTTTGAIVWSVFNSGLTDYYSSTTLLTSDFLSGKFGFIEGPGPYSTAVMTLSTGLDGPPFSNALVNISLNWVSNGADGTMIAFGSGQWGITTVQVPGPHTYTMIVSVGSTITMPGYWTNNNNIHALGGGQSGARANSGLGGIGGSWSTIANTTAFSPGDLVSINIGVGGTGSLVAGGDTWLKNLSGTKILQAKGGGSGSSNIGDSNHVGGIALTPTGGGSFGSQRGGGGGGGAAGPNGPGGNSGDIRADNAAADTYPMWIQDPLDHTDPTTCWLFLQGANGFEPGAGGGAGNGGQPGGGTAALAAVLQHRINTISICSRAGAPPPTTYNLLGPVNTAPTFGTAVLPGDGGDGPNVGDDGGRMWAQEGPSNSGNGSGGGAGGPTPGGVTGNGGTGGSPTAPDSIWVDTSGETIFNNFVAGAGPGGGGGGVGVLTSGGATYDPGAGGLYGGGGGGGIPQTSGGGVGAQGVLVFQWLYDAGPSATFITGSTSIQAKGRLSQPIPVPPPPTPPVPIPPNPFNCLVPVISQYANSPILLTILEDFCEAVDPWPIINEFYNLLWNVDTAVGYGLDVWGRIVGVTRTLEIPAGRFLGFVQQDGSTDPFNVSPFYNGITSNQNFELADDAFRLLILVKAFANISDGSVKSLNLLLRTLFPGEGNAYVTDNGDMSMTYTFNFALTPVQNAIVNQSGVLPRSSGVTSNIVVAF